MGVNPQVSIVIVSMDRMDILCPCLDSIREHTSVSYETFVVAYRFSQANLAALKEEYPWVTVVESNELRGFSENNNLALRKVTGEYTFILNDDTFIDSPVIDRLVEDFAKLPEDTAVVSPNLLYPDGRPQMCGRRNLNGWTYLASYYHLFNETKDRRWCNKEGLFRTYNLSGAAFLIKTSIFKELGWFDETYAFTPEDIALSTILNKRGYGVYVDADVRLYHIAAASSSSMVTAIKPTRVRGSLLFYSNFRNLRNPQGTRVGNPVVYFLLGLGVWLFEALRGIKYCFKDTSDESGKDARMALTARNVRRSIFTSKAPKEVFRKFLGELGPHLVPKDISRHVIVVGEYFDEPGHGGIASVLRSYKPCFGSFNFVSSYRSGKLLHKLWYDLGGLFKLAAMLAWDSVKSVFGKGRYRIVHIHTAAGGSFRNHRYYARIARLFGRKTIMHIHASSFKDYFQDSSDEGKSRIINTLNGVDKVVVLSDSWKGWFESIGVSAEGDRMVVLNNITARPSEPFVKPAREENDLRLLFLGEIGPRKGIFDVLEAISAKKDSLEGRIVLRIGGNHNEEALKEAIGRLGLSDMVTFEGFVTGGKKKDLLLWADVLVLTSYNEGLPISILEAMSYGNAILSTPVGGIPEVVDDRNGILVPPGDLGEISDAILELASLPKEDLGRLGEESRNKVAAFYPEQVMSRLNAIYKLLLGRS